MNKKTFTKSIAWVVTFALALAIFPAIPNMVQAADPPTATFDLSSGLWSTGDDASNKATWNDPVLTVNDGANIEITGTVDDGRRIVVAADATASITLNNASITIPSGSQPPLKLNSGANLTLTIVGTNTLTAEVYDAAAIQAPADTELTVNGTGSLTADGSYGASGIGGGFGEVGGKITIESGTITANGGDNAAGIGGGGSNVPSMGYDGGEITIEGGKVTATGGNNSAGIGGGRYGDGGTITIKGGEIEAKGGSGGAGIGGGEVGDGGTILIENGTVTAEGGGGASGIGGGEVGDGGEITIKAGTVTATGGNNSAGIGGGNGSIRGGDGGTIIIEGGTVTATGGFSGAGIGGGLFGGGDITIDGGVVTATGGAGGAGVGSGAGTTAEIATLKMSGNGVVFASSLVNGSNGILTDISAVTGGILFGGLLGTLYGDVTLAEDLTIPATHTLTISTGSTLTIPLGKKVSNLGTVNNAGTINSGSPYGEWEDNPYETSDFVPVINITNLPTATVTGTPLTLTGTVTPSDATTKTITWSVENAGTTGATITGNTLNTTGTGIVTIRATIENGLTETSDYTQDFNISVVDALIDEIDLSDSDPSTSGTGWTYANNIYTVANGANITFTGTSADERRIEVAADATARITLKNVSISGLGENKSPLLLNSGAKLTLTLTETNELTAGISRAGIQAPAGTELTINGAGSLTATGGTNGAGIGGGDRGDGGTITIKGGEIEAKGGSSGAGIGGGYFGNGGKIIIEGGTVTAEGGSIGAGIGGGFNGNGGEITIKAGTVTATGGNNGAGIGGGDGGISGGDGGTIIIEGGTVTAEGGSSGAGIGGGLYGGGDITIDGGVVTATGGAGGAGVGSGSGTTAKSATLKMSGNGVVFASSLVNGSSGILTDIIAVTKGILFNGVNGTVYGNVSLTKDLTVGTETQTLTVNTGATLTLPEDITLTNSGLITNNGTITGSGGITNNGTLNCSTGNISSTVTGANKANLTGVTFPTGLTATYGQILSAIDLSALAPYGEFEWIIPTASVGNAGNNSHDMQLTWVNSANYNAVEQSVTVSVAPKTLTVTPNSGQWKYFGQTDPTLFNFTYSGNISGETPDFNGTLSRASGEAIDDYAITTGDLGLTDNGAFFADNYTLVLSATTVNFEIREFTTTAKATLSGISGQNDWFVSGDVVTLNPPTGYQISAANSGAWSSSITIETVASGGSADGTDKEAKYFLRSTTGDTNGAVTGEMTLNYNVDTTPPTAQIQYRTNSLRSFLNVITFGLFFKDTITVTIFAADSGSDVDTVQYYKAASEIADTTTITSWLTGTSFTAEAGEKFILYVRVADKAGNSVILLEGGIIVYADSTAEVNARYAIDSDVDLTVNVTMYNNTVKSITDESDNALTLNTDYTTGTNTITFKKEFMETLTLGIDDSDKEYTFIVEWNPLGETYIDDTDNDEPETTTIKITITAACIDGCTAPADWTDGTAATCTEASTRIKRCTECGYIVESESQAELGHTEVTGVWTSGTAATCETSSTQIETCTRENCTHTIATDPTAAKGHDMPTAYTTDTPADCTNAAVETRTCQRTDCDYTQTNPNPASALGHVRDNWEPDEGVCGQPGTEREICTRCNFELDTRSTATLSCNFDWDNAEVTEEPTCMLEGLKTATCTRCGAGTDTRTVDALGHNFIDNWEITLAPTCIANGERERSCTRDCGETRTETITTRPGHSYTVFVSTTATCEAAGLDTMRCSTENCIATTTASRTALGHDLPEDWTERDAPTCEDDGLEYKACQRGGCTHEETQEIDALGHSFANYTGDTATCTVGGTETGTCSRENCAEENTRPTSPLDHDYQNYVSDNNATCTAHGTETGTCVRCGDTNSIMEIDSMLPHTPKTENCTECSVCTTTGLSRTCSTESPCTFHASQPDPDPDPEEPEPDPDNGGGGSNNPINSGRRPTSTTTTTTTTSGENESVTGTEEIIIDVPVTVIQEIAGNLPTTQIAATAAGSQTITTARANAGQNAVLLVFNDETGEFEVVSAATVGADGTATVNIPGAGDYIVVVAQTGDLTGTGNVTAADALLLLQALAGNAELNPLQKFLTSSRSDSKYTATDALNILKFVAGMLDRI